MKYIIGIDVGGTKTAYGLFDNVGNLVCKVKQATAAETDGPTLSDLIIKNIETIVEKNNLVFDDLEGIGIGMPSFINNETGHIYMTSAMPAVKDFPMRDYLYERMKTRIVLDNDANAAALAEFRHGAGRGARHIIYVVIGTGFGCGIIIDGKVFSGSYGAAGEFGHAIATPGEGILCGCENRGCYMSYIAGRHIPERVKLGLEGGIKSRLVPETTDGETLLKAYKDGDLLAEKMISEMAAYVALCLFNVYQMLNIDLFVFGGGLTALGDVFFDKIREEFNKLYHIPFPVHFKISELNDDIGIIGAAEFLR